MATYTETNRVGDVLKREFDPLFNRETVTIVSGQNLACGAVLGKITASGKYTELDPAADTGEEDAAAVLLFDADASDGDVEAVVLKRGPAVVADGNLIFPDGISSPNRAAAITALADLGIVARTTV